MDAAPYGKGKFMDKSIDSIFNSLSKLEAYLAKQKPAELKRCLRLCFLGMMSSSYLDAKLDKSKILAMMLAKTLSPALPELFADSVAELSRRTKERKVVDALSTLNDNWPDELFNPKFALAEAFKPLLPLFPQMDELLQTVDKLDDVKRDNLLSNGQNESDTIHILKVCVWLLALQPHLQHEINISRALELALLHDFVEARSGDFSLSAQIADAGLKLEKKRKELEAIMYYRVSLPAPFNNTVFHAYEEYEERKTPESKLIWALDKLDANWQANQYHDGDVRYWADCPNGEVYYRLALEYKPQIAALEEPILTKLEKDIVAISKANIAKCGIKVK